MELKIGRGKSQLYQWDTGQILEVEDDGLCREVHLCRAGEDAALVCPVRVEGDQRVADIPNILLQSAEPIRAYLQYRWEDGTETRIAKSFPVTPRAKPEDYVYTQTEVKNYQNLEDRIHALEQNPADPECIRDAVNAYLQANPVTPEQIGALAAEKLPEAVNDALAQAKASGEFDGKTPVKGTDYYTEADKGEMVNRVLAALPAWEGGSY